MYLLRITSTSVSLSYKCVELSPTNLILKNRSIQYPNERETTQKSNPIFNGSVLMLTVCVVTAGRRWVGLALQWRIGSRSADLKWVGLICYSELSLKRVDTSGRRKRKPGRVYFLVKDRYRVV